MTFTYRHRKKIFLGSLFVLFLLLITCFMVPRFLNKQEKKKTNTLVLEQKEKKEEPKEVANEVFFQVDIKGAVVNPGIYRVKEGSRVIDVIRLAGDLREDADTTVLNLSKKVLDEMVIIVYTKEEVANLKATKEMEMYLISTCQEGREGTLSNGACREDVEKDFTTSIKVSLNQASKEELMTLEGIGEAKAEAIIKYREEHGGFQTIEALKEVSGIGDALFNQVQENLTL